MSNTPQNVTPITSSAPVPDPAKQPITIIAPATAPDTFWTAHGAKKNIAVIGGIAIGVGAGMLVASTAPVAIAGAAIGGTILGVTTLWNGLRGIKGPR